MTVAANVEHGGTSRGLVPGRPTGPLMIFVGLASAVFTVGTALHAFVIVTPETLERMMVLAGATGRRRWVPIDLPGCGRRLHHRKRCRGMGVTASAIDVAVLGGHRRERHPGRGAAHGAAGDVHRGAGTVRIGGCVAVAGNRRRRCRRGDRAAGFAGGHPHGVGTSPMSECRMWRLLTDQQKGSSTVPKARCCFFRSSPEVGGSP